MRRAVVCPGRTVARAALVVLSVTSALTTAFGRSKTDIPIAAGPASQSAEEKAITSESVGTPVGAVILAEEFEVNEDLGFNNQHGYHLRAKILTPEAASIADVEIPHNINDGHLFEWWGRTILPDGTVVELAEKDLKEQLIGKPARGREVRHLKGALPGVVPGCVIDYGYIFKGPGGLNSLRLNLAREWPVKFLRYRWIPYRLRAASYRLFHVEGLPVEITRDDRSILVTAKDLPLFVAEPWSAPRGELQPGVFFYYYDRGEVTVDYWNTQARAIESNWGFSAKDEAFKDAIPGLGLPPDADLGTKLRRAHEWVVENFENLSHRTTEQVEAEAAKDKDKETAKKKKSEGAAILESRKASNTKINYVFMAFARALGAEAHIVRTPDRTVNYWDQQVFDMDQFAATIIAVHDPAAPADQWTYTDPASGLPYGEVPYWLAGTRAMMATSEGAKTVLVPTPTQARNTSEVKVTMAFAEEPDAIDITWSRRAVGQSGVKRRGSLRRFSPEERKKRIEEICGASSSFEVSQAEATGYESARTPFAVTCAGVWIKGGAKAGPTEIAVPIAGAWIDPIPELIAEKRVHPVIFEFAHKDTTVIDVASPPGFVPKAPPSPVRIEGPFGSYALTVTPNEKGLHVERSFTLIPLKVGVEDYPRLRVFLADVRQADKARLEFRKADKDDGGDGGGAGEKKEAGS